MSRLEAVLASVPTSQLAHLAFAAAEGRIIEHEDPDGTRWLIDPRPEEAPSTYKLWRVGEQALEHGRRAALLDCVAQRLQEELAPHDGLSGGPPWVAEAREAQVEVMVAGMREG